MAAVWMIRAMDERGYVDEVAFDDGGKAKDITWTWQPDEAAHFDSREGAADLAGKCRLVCWLERWMPQATQPDKRRAFYPQDGALRQASYRARRKAEGAPRLNMPLTAQAADDLAWMCTAFNATQGAVLATALRTVREVVDLPPGADEKWRNYARELADKFTDSANDDSDLHQAELELDEDAR